MPLLNLVNVAGRNISSVSSVTLQSLWGKKYEKYESMKSHTFSLEIFSDGKFLFYLFYLFYEFYNKCANITV